MSKGQLKRQSSKFAERLELELLVAGTEFSDLERTVFKVRMHGEAGYPTPIMLLNSAAGHQGEHEGAERKACSKDLPIPPQRRIRETNDPNPEGVHTTVAFACAPLCAPPLRAAQPARCGMLECVHLRTVLDRCLPAVSRRAHKDLAPTLCPAHRPRNKTTGRLPRRSLCGIGSCDLPIDASRSGTHGMQHPTYLKTNALFSLAYTTRSSRCITFCNLRRPMLLESGEPPIVCAVHG
jgi:hypothetical protein